VNQTQSGDFLKKWGKPLTKGYIPSHVIDWRIQTSHTFDWRIKVVHNDANSHKKIKKFYFYPYETPYRPKYLVFRSKTVLFAYMVSYIFQNTIWISKSSFSQNFGLNEYHITIEKKFNFLFFNSTPEVDGSIPAGADFFCLFPKLKKNFAYAQNLMKNTILKEFFYFDPFLNSYAQKTRFHAQKRVFMLKNAFLCSKTRFHAQKRVFMLKNAFSCSKTRFHAQKRVFMHKNAF